MDPSYFIIGAIAATNAASDEPVHIGVFMAFLGPVFLFYLWLLFRTKMQRKMNPGKS